MGKRRRMEKIQRCVKSNLDDAAICSQERSPLALISFSSIFFSYIVLFLSHCHRVIPMQTGMHDCIMTIQINMTVNYKDLVQGTIVDRPLTTHVVFKAPRRLCLYYSLLLITLIIREYSSSDYNNQTEAFNTK